MVDMRIFTSTSSARGGRIGKLFSSNGALGVSYTAQAAARDHYSATPFSA